MWLAATATDVPQIHLGDAITWSSIISPATEYDGTWILWRSLAHYLLLLNTTQQK